MRKLLYSVIVSLMVVFAIVTPVSARAASNLGNDISWPQCGKKLPTGQAFGIVGVTGGLANNTNPCLSTQLAWAASSVGGTSQDKVQLYVNTANPELAGSWWPTDNGGVSNPYGNCDGTASVACAYIYGYNKARDDATIRGVSNPSNYLWWLDVETANSWSTNKLANQADLEGMADYFKSIGARVGLYSTSYQWGQIVGTVTGSSLNGLPSWLPGARNQQAAEKNCSLSSLTSGGTVVLTQFISRNIDYDVNCV